MNLWWRGIFDGSNFNDWIRNIRIAIRYEEKEYVLDKELKEIHESNDTPEQIFEYKVHEMGTTKVSCIMIATMTVEL